MPDDKSYRVQGVKDADVIREARKRYERASKAANENRQRYREAMSFVAGQQWDERLKQTRISQHRPCLTMDRLGTHINQVVNDQRQSKASIIVHPVDDNADVDTAEVLNGVIRNIEHTSNAPMVYETASYCQVAGGQGAWRILTQYDDETSFDQDICIKRILDPTTVTFDPDAREMDASDGMFAFIEENINRDVFKEQYPDADESDWSTQADPMGWWDSDSVRIAEYYRVVMRATTLYLMPDGSVKDEEALANANNGADVPLTPVSSRPGKRREVQWFKIGGNSVLDSRMWPGRWIPIVRVVGNEIVVDGRVQYTGLTHRAMDAARMYNYQTSVMVEMLSLQKTAPWVGAKGQFKGVESRWNQANTTNPAYLEYEPIDVNGQLAPPPNRTTAPQVPTGNVQAMQAAAQDIQWITGQHAANFGAKSNEQSGRAILARQQEGDTATYHYLDNLARGRLHTGRIIVDLIPRIYDTSRILRVLGEDGASSLVAHNPEQQMSMSQAPGQDGKVQRIYNLGVGRYDVAVTVGPNYATKRMESVDAMMQLFQSSPQIAQVAADIFVRNQDWPGAKELADRLKRFLGMQTPQLLQGEEDGAQDNSAQMAMAMEQAQQTVAQQQQMIEAADQQIQSMMAKIQEMEAEALRRDADVATKTEAERIKAEAQMFTAEKQAEVESYKAQVAAIQADRDNVAEQVRQLSETVQALQQAEGQDKPESEDALLQQIAAQQAALVEAMGAMAVTMSQPKVISIQKTASGYEAVSAPQG